MYSLKPRLPGGVQRGSRFNKLILTVLINTEMGNSVFFGSRTVNLSLFNQFWEAIINIKSHHQWGFDTTFHHGNRREKAKQVRPTSGFPNVCCADCLQRALKTIRKLKREFIKSVKFSHCEISSHYL